MNQPSANAIEAFYLVASQSLEQHTDSEPLVSTKAERVSQGPASAEPFATAIYNTGSGKTYRPTVIVKVAAGTVLFKS